MDKVFSKIADLGMESDQSLAGKYRNSHDSAYVGELFQRYTHIIYGVALKYLRDRDDAKDAVIEVFEKTLVELKKHNVEYFKSWIFTVTRNHCLMILRKNKANASKLGEFQKFAIDFMEFDDIIHLETLDTKEKLLLKLEKGISNLKNEQKTCIELYYFDNRSYQDIADLMSIPIQNVKSHLQNGKRNLKLYLTNGKIE